MSVYRTFQLKDRQLFWHENRRENIIVIYIYRGIDRLEKRIGARWRVREKESKGSADDQTTILCDKLRTGPLHILSYMRGDSPTLRKHHYCLPTLRSRRHGLFSHLPGQPAQQSIFYDRLHTKFAYDCDDHQECVWWLDIVVKTHNSSFIIKKILYEIIAMNFSFFAVLLLLA